MQQNFYSTVTAAVWFKLKGYNHLAITAPVNTISIFGAIFAGTWKYFEFWKQLSYSIGSIDRNDASLVTACNRIEIL